jgi:enediyne biosynthesis protein E3
MEMNSIIAAKMENIKNIFQNGRENVSKQGDLNDLVKILSDSYPEFISVAFEGASMEIALKDFAIDHSMPNWKKFLMLANEHTAQIFIGLGWAVAQEKRTELDFVKDLEPGMLFRMWDGCGYFDGILRQRQVIKGQARLDYIPEINFNSYDQGLGRSIWYSTKGEPSKTAEIISNFPPARQSDLWRGIGIACAYVGGCEEERLKTLVSLAGNYETQLGIGAAMVAKSRIQSGSMTNDIETVCLAFANLSAQQAMKITLQADSAAIESFGSWLSFMHKEISAINS